MAGGINFEKAKDVNERLSIAVQTLATSTRPLSVRLEYSIESIIPFLHTNDAPSEIQKRIDSLLPKYAEYKNNRALESEDVFNSLSQEVVDIYFANLEFLLN